MKWPLAFCLLAVAANAGCSVDVSKLRALPASHQDAAPDSAPDRLADAGADAADDADGPGSKPDEPPATSDGNHPADDGPAGDAGDVDDARTNPELGRPDATVADDVPLTPDLPVVSPDLPGDAPDLPADSPDLAPFDVRDSAAPDASPEASDRDAEGDLAAADGAGEAGGLSSGSPCTSADQCQSGFCIASRCCVQSCSSVCYRANQCSRGGSCTPNVGTVTCGDLDAVCGLTVYDYANAGTWSFQRNLQVGNVATGTDQHTLSAVPSELLGSVWIRPSRESKSVTTNPLLDFTLSAPADVYVGIDTRVSVPSWMSGWSDSGLTISYLVYSAYEPTTTVTQRLFLARFPAGVVSLGPLGCTATSNCSMYLTIIRFTDQPAGTVPICR